jgi:hypothetical protein
MRKFAHIVNPVHVEPGSELAVAQPITFETMRTAQRYAAGDVVVELFTTQFAEDDPARPTDFLHTPNLERSVLDVGRFQDPRRLPLLTDVLKRLFDASNADYLIYTNVDIGLQPHFYVAVDHLVDAGYDAFVVNRRTLAQTYHNVGDIPLMYASLGRPHRGWDCFIFRRAAFPHYDLGNVCLGMPRVGLALLANLMVHSDRFREFKKLHLTFHLGDPRGWIAGRWSDYVDHNTREVLGVLRRLEAAHGPFHRDTPPGQFVFRKRFLGPLYEAWVRWSNRLGI